jgi:hypothetical protein
MFIVEHKLVTCELVIKGLGVFNICSYPFLIHQIEIDRQIQILIRIFWTKIGCNFACFSGFKSACFTDFEMLAVFFIDKKH